MRVLGAVAVGAALACGGGSQSESGGGAAAAVTGLGVLMAVLAVSSGQGTAVLSPAAFFVAATVGAALGLVLGPAAAWLLLRSVPLGRALAWSTLGTAAGAVLGTPLPFGSILGAVAGFVAACLWLRRRARAGAPAAGVRAA